MRAIVIRCGVMLGCLPLVAGCVSAPSSAGGGAAADEAPWDPPQLPVVIAGVTGCGSLKSATRPSEGETGSRLPDLTLPCLTEGPPVNLSRLSGRPTVVNLWATWCPPCRQEMPILQAASVTYADRVQFLGVNTRDRADWAADYLGQLDVTYPEVVDFEGQLLTALRSPGLPVTVVLDAEGRIADRQIGRISEARLTAMIEAALP